MDDEDGVERDAHGRVIGLSREWIERHIERRPMQMQGVPAHRVLTVVDEAVGGYTRDGSDVFGYENPEPALGYQRLWLGVDHPSPLILHPLDAQALAEAYPSPDPVAGWVADALADRWREQARAALGPPPEPPKTVWSLYDQGRVAINPDTGEVSIQVPLT